MNITLRLGAGLGRLDERPGHLEHHGDARGVVVGPGVEDAAPDAQVVVMGRDDDPLVAHRGVGPDAAGPRRCALDRPGSSPGIACSYWPSKRGSSLRARNSSTRCAAALPPPSPATALVLGRGQAWPTSARSRASSGACASASRPAASAIDERGRCPRPDSDDPSLSSPYRRPAPSSLPSSSGSDPVGIRATGPSDPSGRKKIRRIGPSREPIVCHVSSR